MRLEKFRRTNEATFVTRSHSTYFSLTLANASTYDIGNFNHYLIIFIREKQSLMDDFLWSLALKNTINNNNKNTITIIIIIIIIIIIVITMIAIILLPQQ